MSGVGWGGVGDKCSRWLPEGIILCFSYHLSCANIILCISWIQLFSVCTKLDHFLVEVTRRSNMTTQWVILTKHWSVRVKWVNALEGVGPLSAFQQLIICSLLTLYDLDPSFLHFYDFQNKIYHKNLINPPPQHNIFFLFLGGGVVNSLCSAVNQNGDLFIFDGHHHMVDENEIIWCCEWNDLPVNCCVGILRWRLPLGVQICQCSGLARRPQTKSQSRGEKNLKWKLDTVFPRQSLGEIQNTTWVRH